MQSMQSSSDWQGAVSTCRISTRRAKNLGTKQSFSSQVGFYGTVDQSRVAFLGDQLRSLLKLHREEDAIRWFDLVRELVHGERQNAEILPCVQVLSLLPDGFATVNPEDLRPPNGLRIPPKLREPHIVIDYSARLLLPKLLLSAVAGISGMSLWTDPDMDLGSAVHTIRPDREKLTHNSGFGAGLLLCHTDGYWNDQAHTPVWNVVLCVANPFHEPTRFVRVADIFRILERGHEGYQDWARAFGDLVPAGLEPCEFVHWVVGEALEPQFDLVMGQIGEDAVRAALCCPAA